MKKSSLFLFLAIICFTGRVSAQSNLQQPCMTDEMTKRIDAMDPQLKQYLNNFYQKQINQQLKNIDLRKAHLTTQLDESGNPTFWYDIPVVVHLIHDYNNSSDYLSDNYIFNALNDWNVVYAKQNSDTSDVIIPYKKWIGNPHIRLHLATIDPNGNPTHGITRHRSYLTYIGGDQSKLDDWAPTSYVNIWSVNQMNATNGFAAAYAYWPAEAAGIPFWDGIICLYNYVDNGGGTSPGSGNSYKTINHEMGHVFNLLHPWGSTNVPYPVSLTPAPGNVTEPAADEADATPCGDDGVDDTPPTKGHYVCNCQPSYWPYSFASTVSAAEQTYDKNENGIYDTVCAQNYFVLYTNVSGGDSLVNYPDTTNVQNIMDYSYCAKMFTRGQVARMHAALNSSIAGRTNLWDTANLIATGVLTQVSADSYAFVPRVDLKPIPEFFATTASGANSSAGSYMDNMGYFTIPNNPVWFHNETWNDTVTSLEWIFSNGASDPTSASTGTFSVSFTQPGWVDLKMIATGNNSGTDTAEWTNSVFVANTSGTPAVGYFQEWEPNGDYQQWPSFNYYQNEFYWGIDSSVGFDDHYCMKYKGFDSRINPLMGQYPVTGTPVGDFDDFFSVPMDLSTYTGASCNLDFMYAGATRSSSPADVNDSLVISYSTNGKTWTRLKGLTGTNLVNNGALATEFVPTSPLNWSPMTISLPAAAITPYTVFRFRYWPNAGSDGIYSSGNDYYIDRISFSNNTASVNNVNLGNTDVAVVPNPTSGDAFVVIKDAANNVNAQITVTDITGKVVYTINQLVIGGEAQIMIPHSAISVAGMYIVQATTGSQTQTRKLVVY